MEEVFIIVCLLLMLICALSAAMFRSMLKSAMSLAAISALLAIVLFMMNAIWAALFELSVCAGLITVIFVSAISLTTPDRHDAEHARDHRARFVALPVILIFCGVTLLTILGITNFDLSIAQDAEAMALNFKEVLWGMRQADILGQIIIVLAGAFAVVVLFKEGNKI